jgi:DNA-binding transcriptional LysR family regulator
MSFTAAAQDLQLSQAAVSLQVKALERSVRVRLFERRGNTLALTEAGRALLDSARVILKEEEQARRVLAELAGGRRGKLAIGANTTAGMYVVPELLLAFGRTYPEAQIELHIDPAVRIFEQIHQHIIDCGLVGGPVEDARFVVEHLQPDPLVLICSPRHGFAGRRSVDVHELAGQPFIVPESTSVLRGLIEKSMREAGVAIRIHLQLHEAEPVKKAVEANLGLAIVSTLAVSREVASGHLWSATIDGISIPHYLELVSRDRYLSPLALQFKHFARAFLRDGHGRGALA